MYILVKLRNGHTIEYWGVSSWDYFENNLAIYFQKPKKNNNINMGMIRGGKVLLSFIPLTKVFDNDKDSLKVLK